MQQTQAEPSSLLYWGTNQHGGTAERYAGRVHVVWPDNECFGLCGLPIEEIWEQRPPVPDNLCPLCCVRAMAALFPAFAESLLETLSGPGRHEIVMDDHRLRFEDPVERTAVIPTVEYAESLT